MDTIILFKTRLTMDVYERRIDRNINGLLKYRSIRCMVVLSVQFEEAYKNLRLLITKLKRAINEVI